MQNIIKFLFVSGLAVTLASCGAVGDNYGNQNPNNFPKDRNYPNNNSVYKAGDGTVYRRGDIYRDRNGNVFQNGRVIRKGDVYGQPGILGRNGNQDVYYPNNNQRRLPPGQAKKIYGGNAKDYAPGQVKKRNNRYGNDRRYENDAYNRNRGQNEDDRGFRDQDDKGNKKLKEKSNNGKRKD